ncbi:hypothetical protein [Synechococcus sp. PCC 7336]|uniref:hypothetical protein n=1 Tax=Synechococcus sp. PCC 7336 TaxID=195250 RepID=UPI000345BFA0|nr:hypothetical protein [Synechococcus sp. PCC 7336]
MAVQYDRTVIGYHGCSQDTAERILADPTGSEFQESENDYDWLGRGIYFWEYGLDRALQWSQKRFPSNSGVVGALIQLGNCFDLMDTRFTLELGEAASQYVSSLQAKSAAQPIPKNVGQGFAARKFDCAVINTYLQALESRGTAYDTVRCGFVEAGSAYSNQELRIHMGIYQQSHIQLAIRNPRCIIGAFRPRLEE